ncbi:MAG: tetratricopeptide repeat protein, partial [Candidatus Kapaibacterium sp.]
MTAPSDPITVENFTTLWDYSNPAATEERFRELLPEASADHRYHIELLTQIARTYGLRREFHQAHTLLDEAETLLNSYLPEESMRPRMRYLLERGRTWNSSGKPDVARPLFLDAWEIGKKGGEDRLAIDAAHMMGIIEPSEEALRWNHEALEFAERSSDESARLWLGSLYNNIGVTYLEAEEYEKALEYYRKGLNWHIERNSPERPLNIARWCVARAQRSCGQVEEALAEQRE